MINPDKRQRLREAVRFFYDLQKLRIQQGNRAGSETIMLDEHDREFHDTRSKTLNQLERAELKNVQRLCKTEKIYKWLRDQKGIGPTMAGVIMSEVDIERAGTVSALWKFTGLDVQISETDCTDEMQEDYNSVPQKKSFRDWLVGHGYEAVKVGEASFQSPYFAETDEDGNVVRVVQRQGKAPRPTKGQKLTYNAWFRTKIVGVAADCMIKAGSDWRQFYDNYKLRKQSTLVDQCMGCDGTGKAKKGENKGKKCKNCKGKGGKAPWGESDGHRHRAAIRYMMKMFLQELWTTWRTHEGLEVSAPYAEAVLGRVHGDHGGAGTDARI